MPDNKFVPPSDAVEVKSSNSFVPPSDAVEVKKKVATGLQSGQPKASSLSATQKTAEQKPSASSGSANNIFSGYPGKEAKEYKLQNGMWYEYSSTTTDENGKDVDLFEQPIVDAKRVGALNKVFKQKAGTSEYEQTFTGYPGQEGAEYRIRNGNWEKKQYNNDKFVPINNENSAKSLNAYFKKNASFGKTTVTKEPDINAVNSSIIAQNEERVVPYLRKKFPDFIFDETGIMTDNIRVIAPNGKKIELPLDNWSDDDNLNVSIELKEFIKQNHDAKEKYLTEEYEKATERFRPAQWGDKEYIEDSPWGQPSVLIDPLEKFGLVNVEKEKKIKETRAELVQFKADRLADIYVRQKEAAKTGAKIDDKQVSAALSALTPNKATVKMTNEYFNDIQKTKAVITKENNDLKNYAQSIVDKLESGEITQEEVDNVYKPQIEQRSNALNEKINLYDSQTKDLYTVNKGMQDSLAENYIIQESKGSFGGGVARGFVKGLTYLPRLAMSMSEKEQNDIVTAIVGSGTTGEYMSSEDRSEVTKALFSLSESIGTLAGGAAFGGGAATTASFFSQGYYDMKDELDTVEGMSDTNKVLMSSSYGVLSGLLEKFGVEYSMGKSTALKGVSNTIKNSIMKTAFQSLPKDATKEMIENAIKNSITKQLTSGALKIVGGAAVEGTTEALQAVGKIGIKEVYDLFQEKSYFDNESAWEITKDVIYEGAMGSLAGGLMSTISSVPSAINKGFTTSYNKEQINALMNLSEMENSSDQIKAMLKTNIASGKISAEDASQIAKSFDMLTSKLKELPEDLTDDNKAKSLDLIIEKDKIERQISGKDKALVTAQTDRINAINEELKAISINNSKTQQDATKESTEQQQEVPTEGGTVEYQGANQGQQEVGQGEGSERTATQPEANISDSDIASEEEKINKEWDDAHKEFERTDEDSILLAEGYDPKDKKAAQVHDEAYKRVREKLDKINDEYSAKLDDLKTKQTEAQVIPSIETKIEEHEQRTENEVVAPNIETTTTKKAKSIPRTRKALDVETNDLQDLVKKHFISGGKVNVNSAMQSLFGNKRDKSVASEYRKRIGLHSKGGQTIDGLAHLLWEQNRDTLGESVTTTEWRDAVESVLTNEVGTKNMIDSLMAKSEESVTDAETKYWENKYDMNAIQDFDESELMDAESVLDNMTDEEMAQMYDEINASEQAEYNPTLDEVKQIKDKTLYTEKAYSFFDDLSKQLDRFGKENSSMGIAPAILKPIIETIKLGLKAGMTIEQAIKDASVKHKVKEQDINDAIYSMSEAQKAKTRERVTGEKQGPTTQKTEASKAAKNISKKEKTKVTVDEYTALRDQLRLEAKAARESKADLKAKQADLIARFNAMKVKGKMNTNTVTAIINRIKNLNLDNQAKVDAFLDYAANVFKNVNYDTELSKGLKLKGAISKSLKGKSNPFAKLAREFSKLNVRWVENIEEYNAIAQKVHDSVRNSKLKKDENGKYILDLKQEADIQEIYDYFIKEKDSQSQRLEDNYRKLYEETTGKSATGKTIAELKSEMALAKIDYTAEKRQAIEDKLDEFKDLAKSTPDVSDKVKEALNVDLDVLDIKEAVALLDALDTYFANGTTAKMSNIMGNYRGKYNAKNSKLRASKLRLAGSRKIGKVMNEYFTNLGITAERLFRGHTGGEQFQKESGFTSVYNGANRAETETRNKSDEYTKLFKKRKGFDTIENIYERNVMAFLDRSPEIQEDADFFAIRKKLLQQSYETLMNGSDAEKVMGEVYKKVFDKLDLDNAKDINDIINKSSNDNVEAVRYIQQMFSDVHPELSEFALDMHNTMLARDNNYTPDVYKKTSDNRNTPVFDESSFAFGNFANITLDKSEAGVLIESSRPKALSKGMFISLDFENNMFNAHRLALTDMYTAEGIRQFDSYMKSDDIETIIPDSEDRQIMRDSMNGYVNDKKGKTFTEKALISEFKKITNYFGKLGAFRALGSIRQFPIQYASAVTNALVATGFGKNGVYIDLKAPFDKRINKLINESGRSIANRGVESAISAMNKETDVMPVLNTSGKVAKVVEYPIDKAAKANAVVLKQVLGNADNYGARTMWWAFYKKSLADQGLKVDFDKINDKAADYAQSMTDRQAEVSDVSLRGKVFKSKNPTTAFIKDVLMPFAGFSLNQKNRLYSDFRNMFAGQTQEDRTFAARSFFATAAEVAVTAKIRLFVAEMMVSAAAGLLGLDDDDEEVKEMYDKLEKENKQNTYSRIIQDIASPNPVFDKFILRQVNKLLDMTGYSDPDMKEFDKMIEDINAKKAYRGEELLTDEEIAEKKEDYILDNKFNFYTSDDADWGYYGILPKKIEETQEIISVYNTGKFQKEFGGKMVDYYLTESDRKKLKNVVGLKLAANILPAESDMISNKALKIIKEKGMSESKFKTYEQINKEIKVTPFVEMLIRETTMSNEKIISYSKYAESDGQLTEKQIKEYNNLKTIYGSKAIGFIEELKSGKTAKQIMGK